jgi:hypothetical protein
MEQSKRTVKRADRNQAPHTRDMRLKSLSKKIFAEITKKRARKGRSALSLA